MYWYDLILVLKIAPWQRSGEWILQEKERRQKAVEVQVVQSRVVLSVRMVAKGDREVEELALIFETESKGVFNGLNFKISEKTARRFLDV